MVFVADDLAAWLIGLLADAGRKRLTTMVLGTDQERALRSAATTAVQVTAAELCPGDERAGPVISQVFDEPVPGEPLAAHETVLEALQAGMAGQLAVLDDARLTGTGQSSADVLGVSAGVIAERLTGHLVREIVARGSRGGPLFPLASQLNDDLTHLQAREMQGTLREILDALAQLDSARGAAAPPAGLAQLPPGLPGFTGRDADLAMLARLLDPASPEPVAVSAVAGLAGVGKTALAVEAGHAARRRGWFGGGVMFIDLHGYDDQRVEPGPALDALLRALGVPAERIPPGAEERAGLYRSVLAQLSQPVLVIADNASSEVQVKPLLPGAGPHKVLVTSRDILAGLGGRLIDVTILDESSSIALLDAALRTARPDDDRISGDRAAATRLAAVCGGLALALQIAAALLKSDPTLGTAELAEELAAESVRLNGLRYEDGSGAAGPSVEAAFELSYRRLDRKPARLFRLLPLSPGPDVSTAAAAALAGLPPGEVRRLLAALARAHLAEAAPGQLGRWRMHDLLRLYAQGLAGEQVDADGAEEARDRLLGYYLRLADAASQHLRALPGNAVPDAFAGRDDALAWLDTERAGLVAAVHLAADTGRDRLVMSLAAALTEYFDQRPRSDDWLPIAAAAVIAARNLRDRHAEGETLVAFGRAVISAGVSDPVTVCQQAVAVCRETGNRLGEGRALANLGLALLSAGQPDQAIDADEEAAAVFREVGDRHSWGKVVNNLGVALRDAGRFDEAIGAHQNALAVMRETGDRRREGRALGYLGGTLRQAGRFAEAVTAHQEAAGIAREISDRHGESLALADLGLDLRGAGRLEEAIAAARDSVTICRETGDRYGETIGLVDLGAVLGEAGRLEEAIAAHQDALGELAAFVEPDVVVTMLLGLGSLLRRAGRFEEAISPCRDAAIVAGELGYADHEGLALENLALTLLQTGRYEEAITACQDAAGVFRDTGDRSGEALALANLGAAFLGTGRSEEAVAAGQDAAAVSREAGDRFGEAMALNNLGSALLSAGRSDESVAAFRDAAAIFCETGHRDWEALALENLEKARAARSALSWPDDRAGLP